MVFELFLALRYLRAKRKQMMISVITLISTLGVTIGVCALVIVLAVMSGFANDLREKILGANSHGVIFRRDGRPMESYEVVKKSVEAHADIVAAAPFIYQQGILRHGKRVSGVVVKGINPALSRRVVTVTEKMRSGSFDELMNPPALPGDESEETAPLPGIVIGEELAASLGLISGENVFLISPFGTQTPMGMVPKSREYRVCGIFYTGMYDYDSSWAYLSISEAQDFFSLDDRVSGIEIRMQDPFKADRVTTAISQKLGQEYYLRDWMSMNQSFFEALKLEKIVMFIILLFIVTVAAFGIVSSLMMMVMEKNKDIGILKAMGATSKSILLIFMAEGLIIGIMGTFFGALLGLSVSWVADKYQLIKLSGDVYYITHLPFQINSLDVFLICTLSIFISFLATIYPSMQASRLRPVEAIRYE
ncbi:lipoprotein-releasing ABC transporter permease subunit [candidate division CSSED10-310 bacterium]|uniref:Lipoprotein-releasing ABC transporter permease subunit n=1 Tax=candidate division CSSED10-310 bacterium TaxID=2855610 RepID=A0ABV6YY39_UNCC1